jgi:hypothetical protein
MLARYWTDAPRDGQPITDHRSSQFAELAKAVFDSCQKIFKTACPVIIFPSSGTGASEAAIVNTLSPGDKVLMVETGHFAMMWQQMVARCGIDVDLIPGDWRHGVDPAAIEARLAQDTTRPASFPHPEIPFEEDEVMPSTPCGPRGNNRTYCAAKRRRARGGVRFARSEGYSSRGYCTVWKLRGREPQVVKPQRINNLVVRSKS